MWSHPLLNHGFCGVFNDWNMGFGIYPLVIAGIAMKNHFIVKKRQNMHRGDSYGNLPGGMIILRYNIRRII